MAKGNADKLTQAAVAVWAILSGLVLAVDGITPDELVDIITPLDGLPKCLTVLSGMVELVGGVLLLSGLFWWGRNLRPMFTFGKAGWILLGSGGLAAAGISLAGIGVSLISGLWGTLLAALSIVHWLELDRVEHLLEARKDARKRKKQKTGGGVNGS